MKSPYQRLIEACGVSQDQFQNAFGFTKPTFVQIITGQYPNLSDRMILSLGQLCAEKGIDARKILRAEYGQDTLQDAYHSWQRSERVAVCGKYLIEPPMGWNKDNSPFDMFVSKTAGSRARFCKDLKVDAARVYEYATGRSQSMPTVIQKALTEIHYPWLNQLSGLQDNWRLRWTQ